MRSELIKICHETLRFSKLLSLNSTWWNFEGWTSVLRRSIKLDIFFVDSREDKWHSGYTATNILLSSRVIGKRSILWYSKNWQIFLHQWKISHLNDLKYCVSTTVKEFVKNPWSKNQNLLFTQKAVIVVFFNMEDKLTIPRFQQLCQPW